MDEENSTERDERNENSAVRDKRDEEKSGALML